MPGCTAGCTTRCTTGCVVDCTTASIDCIASGDIAPLWTNIASMFCIISKAAGVALSVLACN